MATIRNFVDYNGISALANEIKKNRDRISELEKNYNKYGFNSDDTLSDFDTLKEIADYVSLDLPNNSGNDLIDKSTKSINRNLNNLKTDIFDNILKQNTKLL